MKRGWKVVKVLDCGGIVTASIGWRVSSIKRGVVRIERDGEESSITYDTNGKQIESTLLGVTSYLIKQED